MPATYADASSLRELLRILVRKTGILERGEATCCSITISQCHALVEIGRKENISVNQLAELLGLDKSTVSRAVDKLVVDGTVLREEHPEDRRVCHLAAYNRRAPLVRQYRRANDRLFSRRPPSGPRRKAIAGFGKPALSDGSVAWAALLLKE